MFIIFLLLKLGAVINDELNVRFGTRCWVHMNPVSQKRLLPGSVPAAIILEPPTLIADFDIHPKARPSSSMRKLLRYQPNPEKNWGPGMRAKCK